MKVIVSFNRVVTYEKEIELTEYEYNILNDVNGNDLNYFKDEEAFNIIDNFTSKLDITSTEDNLENFQIEKI